MFIFDSLQLQVYFEGKTLRHKINNKNSRTVSKHYFTTFSSVYCIFQAKKLLFDSLFLHSG